MNSCRIQADIETLKPIIAELKEESAIEEIRTNAIAEITSEECFDYRKYPEFDKSFGKFCRVVIKRTGNEVSLNCTCNDYMRRGTCRETRFFGFLSGNLTPPSECTDPIFVGWNKVRSNLLEQWKVACEYMDESFNRNYHLRDLHNLVPPPPQSPYGGDK